MKQEFEARAKKIDVLYNGYDEDDFSKLNTSETIAAPFTIRYVGNLMASQNVEALWKVIAGLENTPT